MNITLAGLAGSALMLLFFVLLIATEGVFLYYVVAAALIGFLAMTGYSLGNFLFGPKGNS